jgi:hypothetical protein
VERGIFLFFFGAAGGVGHLPHQGDVIGPVGRLHEDRFGLPFWRQPVTKGCAGVVLPEEAGIALFNRAEILRHGVPVLIDDAGVAGLQPRGPGNDDAGIAPAGAESGVGHGGARRIDAIHRRADLGAAEIGGEFAREGREAHVVRRRAPEDFGIPGPAEALVALRAVGGDADEVGALAPKDVAPELIEHGAAGSELCVEGGIGVDHFCGDGRDVGPGGKAGELDVAEAVEGEGGLVSLFSVTGKSEIVCGERGAEVFGVDGAVGVEDFGKAKTNLCARFTLDADVREACHVLTEVVDVDARRGLGEGFGVEGHFDADGLVVLRNDGGLERLDGLGRMPAGVAEAGGRPPGLLETCVVRLAVVDLGFLDG